MLVYCGDSLKIRLQGVTIPFWWAEWKLDATWAKEPWMLIGSGNPALGCLKWCGMSYSHSDYLWRSVQLPAHDICRSINAAFMCKKDVSIRSQLSGPSGSASDIFQDLCRYQNPRVMKSVGNGAGVAQQHLPGRSQTSHPHLKPTWSKKVTSNCAQDILWHALGPLVTSHSFDCSQYATWHLQHEPIVVFCCVSKTLWCPLCKMDRFGIHWCSNCR